MLDDPGTLGILVRGILQSEERETRPRFFRQGPREIDPVGLASRVSEMAGPVYSDLPFGEALKPLLKPSLNAVAERAGMAPSHLHGMMKGSVKTLKPERLEAVARAVRVNPGYFREYREQMISVLINERLSQHPQIALSIYHALSSADSQLVR